MPISPPLGAASPASLREERKRTVEADTSKDAPELPSCFCHMRGPP
jgi:hypothetical protein